MAQHLPAGSIEVIFGPMFSGKSTELCRIVKRYTMANKKCLILNYAMDNRYSDEEVVSTHDRQTMKAMKRMTISDIGDSYKEYDVIAIDEGQFFKDIVEKAEQFANEGKIVVVAALDATFQRTPFDVINLLPIAEKITKLTAICDKCKREASFTMRLGDNKEIELIGNEQLYRPVCRQCFMELTAPKEMTDMRKFIVQAKEKSDSVSTASNKEEKDNLSNASNEDPVEVL